MQEFTTPGAVDVPPNDNVITALLDNEGATGGRLCRTGPRTGSSTCPPQLVTTVRELAAGLVSLGIEPGSRVCLFMPAHRVHLPRLRHLGGGLRHGHHLRDVVGRPGRVDRGQQRRGGRDLRLGPAAQGVRLGGRQAPRGEARVHGGRRGRGRAHQAGPPDRPERGGRADRAGIKHEDLGTLVYTSGTTGRPKGALTHGNLIWDSRQAAARCARCSDEDSCTLAFLPLAHILAPWCRWRA